MTWKWKWMALPIAKCPFLHSINLMSKSKSLFCGISHIPFGLIQIQISSSAQIPFPTAVQIFKSYKLQAALIQKSIKSVNMQAVSNFLMPTIIPFVLLMIVTLLAPSATEAAIVHPRLRKHVASSIFTAMPSQGQQQHAKIQQQPVDQPKKEQWTGEEVREILMQIQQGRSRNRNAASSNSFLDRFLAFFTPPSAEESADRQRQRQMLNNCFFTPMNCRVAPGSRGMAANSNYKGGGIRGGEGSKGAPMVLMISDEEKTQLLAKHGHHLRHREQQTNGNSEDSERHPQQQQQQKAQTKRARRRYL